MPCAPAFLFHHTRALLSELIPDLSPYTVLKYGMRASPPPPCQRPRSTFLSTMPKTSTVRQSAELKPLQPRNSLFEEELESWLWLYELFDTEDQACNGIVRMYLLRHPECNPDKFDYYAADYYSNLTTTEHHRHYNTWFQVRSVFYSNPAMC
jgi:hypothetical protein